MSALTQARLRALLGTLLFTLAAPGTVAFLVPLLIRDFYPSQAAKHPMSWLLILPAAAVLLESLFRFAWHGLGTAAPIAPTKYLVINGLYRYVRNPMYLAVISLVLGQAIYFSNFATCIYAVFLAIVFQLFVTRYEEPTLRRTYGIPYDHYCARVHRWLPRLP